MRETKIFKTSLLIVSLVALSGCSTIKSVFSSDLKCASLDTEMNSPCGRLEPINKSIPDDLPVRLRGPYQYDDLKPIENDLYIFDEAEKADV